MARAEWITPARLPDGWDPRLPALLPSLDLGALQPRVHALASRLRRIGVPSSEATSSASVLVAVHADPALAGFSLRGAWRAVKRGAGWVGDRAGDARDAAQDAGRWIYRGGKWLYEKGEDLFEASLDMIFAALEAVLKRAVGERKARSLVRLLRAVIASQLDVLWLPIELVWRLVPILFDGLASRDMATEAGAKRVVLRLWRGINLAITETMLDSPLVVAVLGAAQEARGGSAEQTRDWLRQASAADPSFGLRAVSWIVALASGGCVGRIVDQRI